jgi:hypothetical protein
MPNYTGTFTYQGGLNPPIDFPRFIISDTQEFAADGTTPIYVFSDQEILTATKIEMSVWQSGQFWSGPQGVTPLQNSQVIPWRRIGATLLDSMAANKAKLSSVLQILDVKLNPNLAAKALMDQAAALREADDNSGAFVLIEQVNDWWSFSDRYWKTVQRQSAGGI